ncbi:hypothetical protein NDU88_005337 [Pleurodeles waltl]|uniref:Uncharacterized protein n=1 Tax=Pleurodeles waltl TaxID=8319 RepID=A0AAV7W9A5_PLEWA|nr:hypothetical protein NDU88_005337 [Pleurodeles waltl]
MERMSECIDKHAERLDHVENRVAAAEDGQTELAGGQMKLNRELSALLLKVDDMEARSQRNNLRIVGIAESTAITSMENYIEQLLPYAYASEIAGTVFSVGIHLSFQGSADLGLENDGYWPPYGGYGPRGTLCGGMLYCENI